MRLLIVLFVLLLAPAAADVPDAPLPLQRQTLPNGLEVVVVESHAVPLVTIEVAVHNGAMNEPPMLNGLSHLYEHMFFKGNAVIPNQEAYLKRLRELGALWNGTTGNERVNYFFTMGSLNLDAGLKFMRDALVTPRFQPQELVREREVVLGEFDRNEADPEYHLFHAVDQKLWYKYPSYKDPLGTRESISRATVDQMRFMQRTYYLPNNSLLVIAGDVKPAQAFSLARKWFGTWKRGADPFQKYPLVRHPPLARSAAVIVRQPVQTVKLAFAWQGPSTAGSLRETMVADVFSFAVNQDGSRLQKALVDSGLAVSARFGYHTLRNTGQISLVLECPPDRALAAIKAARAEVARFGDPDYLTETQWSNAKTLLAVEDLYGREQTSELSHTLSFWWSVAGIQAYLDYIPTVRSATRAEGAAYAARHLVGRPLVLGVLVGIEDETRHGINQEAVEKLLAVTSRVAGSQVAAARVDVPAVESFSVDGVDVLLRRQGSSPVVAASLYVRGGVTNMTRASEGIERLALTSAVRGGPSSMSREDYAARLNEMGAEVGTAGGTDYSRVDLRVVGDFFGPAWELFSSAVMTPGFRAADVELYRRRQIAAIREELEDPDSQVRRLSEDLFHEGHPYALRTLGNEDVVRALTPEQLAGYYKTVMQKSRLLLVVVGDVDRARVEAAVRGSLARLPHGTYRPPAVPPPRVRPAAVRVTDRRLPTAYVRGMFVGPSVTSSDYPAAVIALNVLYDRFFEEVRTKRNLSYSTSAALGSRRANFGVFYVTSTKPSEAVDVMMDQVRRLRMRPLTSDELQEQVNIYITQYWLGMETSQAQADQIGHAQIVAGDWRHAYTLVSRLRAVTPAQIQDVARRYLKGVQWAVLGTSLMVSPGVFQRE